MENILNQIPLLLKEGKLKVAIEKLLFVSELYYLSFKEDTDFWEYYKSAINISRIHSDLEKIKRSQTWESRQDNELSRITDLVLEIVNLLRKTEKEIDIEKLYKNDEIKNEETYTRALRLLIGSFVTDWELIHLRKLDGVGIFGYDRSDSSDNRFINELIRLWDLNLIDRHIDSFLNLPPKGDLKNYCSITDYGKEYLDLRVCLGLDLSSRSKDLIKQHLD